MAQPFHHALHHRAVASRQRGVALVVGLIFLALLTLVAITAVQTTVLEEKMAGGLKNENLAFQAAESALRDAEVQILTKATLPKFDDGSSPGLYDTKTNTWAGHSNPWTWTGWSDATKTRAYSGSLGLPTNPRYVIEELPAVRSPSDPARSIGNGQGNFVHPFRITARGVGSTVDSAGNANVVVILETYYLR